MSRTVTTRPSISRVKLTHASKRRRSRREWLGQVEIFGSLGLIAKDMAADSVEFEAKPNGRWTFIAKANGVAVFEAKGYSGPLPQFSSLPEELRQRVFKRWGRECYYCGATTEPFHVDHRVPIAKGGTDEIDNLVPACLRCNLSKGAKLLEEWLPEAAE